MTNKNENLKNRIVPTGDKGVIGERDDMLHPVATNKRGRFEHIQRYQFALQHIQSNKRVLDLGCGTGYGSYLCFQAQNEVYSLDISEKAINYAKEYYPGPHYFVNSAEQLPFEDGFFDAVIAYEIIEHVEHPDKVIKEIHRVLKKMATCLFQPPIGTIFMLFLNISFSISPTVKKVVISITLKNLLIRNLSTLLKLIIL
ncbi:MAG TPA: class I SAM-dependent methyltransferase [Candidatus Paceibacterota bacterium]|nr:class I SAM-dependent methyltransferase [Candidatus Paceibacterota bacterium]